MIVANKISKSFTDAETEICIFDQLSFTVDTGEAIALMGQSGAGKSTLLHLIGGFDALDNGYIQIDGQNISKMKDAQASKFRLQQIGMIFQQYNLIPSLTALDNITFGRRLKGLPAQDEFTRQLVSVLKLNSRLSHYPAQLSGGEQQRVAIARALAACPTVILADEPTGNLDEDTADQVMTQLMESVALRSTTLLLVTHSHSTASYLQKTWRLEHGNIQC